MSDKISVNVVFWTSIHTRQCISSARDGSKVDLATIASNMEKVPEEYLGEALAMFISHFRVTDGFNPTLPLPATLETQYEQVQQSFLGLANSRLRLSAKSDCLSAIESSWPNISKWAQIYFFDKCLNVDVPQDIPPGREELQAQTVLTSAFELFSSIKDAYSRLAHQDSTFALLAKLWLTVVPNTHLDTSVRIAVMRQMKLALRGALAGPYSLSAAYKETMKSTAGNQPTVVADAALTALTKMSESKFQNDDLNFILHSVNVVNLLLYTNGLKGDSSVFHKALVDMHVARIAVEILLHFTTSSNHSLEYSEEISVGCLRVVAALLGSGGALTQVARMLKLGLLEGITKFIISFYSDNTSPDLSTTLLLKNIVGNMLPNNLFHYPVVAAAIKSTDGLIHSRAIRVLELGVIRDEWSFFFNMLLERAAAKALYDLKLKNENHRTCHNCGVSKTDPGQEIMACAGCRCTFYCSRDCQKAGWAKKNHAFECNVLKELPGDIYFSFHSNFFLPKLIAFDLRRHLPGIKKLLASSPEFRNVKGSDVGYAISYVNVKQEPILEISLFCASSVTDASTLKSGERPKAGSPKFDHALLRSLRSDQAKDMSIVHSTVYRGGARADSTFYGLLKSDLKLPAMHAAGESFGMSRWGRRKARDDQGREIATGWDVIDDILFRALDTDQEQVDALNVSIDSELDGSESETPPVDQPPPASRPVETVFDHIVRFAKKHEADIDSDGIVRHITPEYDDS